MDVNPATDRFFYCVTCRERNGGETDRVRALKPGRAPSCRCDRCGDFDFAEFDSAEDRQAIIDRLGARSLHSARVFFCRRCGDGAPQIAFDGEKGIPARCGCGSRYFDEVIGPARLLWLRSNREAWE
jgi:hypothetical protein